MVQFACVEGVIVEPVGAMWVAFSPVTGETTLLNDESAAILEMLHDGPADTVAICAALDDDSGVPADELVPMVEAHWPQLLDAGLIRALNGADTSPA